jgi:hypothetical protein
VKNIHSPFALDGANVTHLIYNYKRTFVQGSSSLKNLQNGTSKKHPSFMRLAKHQHQGGDDKNQHCYAPLGGAFVVLVFQVEQHISV